jgi:hypothetical protein
MIFFFGRNRERLPMVHKNDLPCSADEIDIFTHMNDESLMDDDWFILCFGISLFSLSNLSYMKMINIVISWGKIDFKINDVSICSLSIYTCFNACSSIFECLIFTIISELFDKRERMRGTHKTADIIQHSSRLHNLNALTHLTLALAAYTQHFRLLFHFTI